MNPVQGSEPTRRAFLQHATLAAAAAAAVLPTSAHAKTKANDTLGIGLIGCGGRMGGHAASYDYVKKQGVNVRIVAVCDTYRPRMERMGKKYGAKMYMDHRELLADPDVDAVSIATPDHLHGYQAIDAMKAGKGVYCEKPVTHWRQFELTKELARVAKETGCVFQLGSQGMSDPAWAKMRELVQQGLIGQPIHAECGYFRVGDWGERGMPIDDENAQPGPDLNWEAFLGDAPKRPFDVSRYFRWRMYEDYSGGPSTDLFPHSFTPVASILSLGMPRRVVAVGGKYRYSDREVPDTYNTLVEYADGLVVAILGTQGNDYQATGGRGAGGRIPVIRGWDGTLTVKDNDILFIPAEGAKKDPQTIPVGGGEDTQQYFMDFVQHCLAKNPNTASGPEMALHVQTALQMGVMAQREGKAVDFDPYTQTFQPA
ncbi:MAG TPA: Gfo/Idh/MocA family oxidoreductase [Candidatus Hydrogenedentes bacterium]|nr:Gfo/Idh/MocA family oxidoreductase [Candidatus Hydrogenedentota bacterium]